MSVHVVVIALILLTGGSCCVADVIRLPEGAELRGSVVEAGKDSLTIITLGGATVEVPRKTIVFAVKRSRVEEEYETRAATAKTIIEHWELAEWCREEHLTNQREWQLRLLLRLHPDHKEANRALRRTRAKDGYWLTYEQKMARRGMVKFGTRYITRQQRALRFSSASDREQASEWTRKIGSLSRYLSHGENKQKLQELRSISDPLAVTALTQFLSDSPKEQLRAEYVGVLSRINNVKVVEPLVERMLLDGSPQLRAAVARMFPGQFRQNAIEQLHRFLRQEDNDIVRRAATVLGAWGSTESISELIDSLETEHQYSASGVGGIRPASRVNDQEVQSTTVRQMFRSGIMPTHAIRHIPIAADRHQITFPHRNREALDALVKITGQNFGYDQRSWRLWHRSSRKPI